MSDMTNPSAKQTSVFWIGFGLLCCVLGPVEYWMLAREERRGETIFRIWPEAMMYSIGGKAGVLAGCLTVGALAVTYGAILAVRARSSR